MRDAHWFLWGCCFEEMNTAILGPLLRMVICFTCCTE